MKRYNGEIVRKYKDDLLDKLIDNVHDHTIADLPRNWRGDQPALFIKDLDALKEEMRQTMKEYASEQREGSEDKVVKLWKK